MIGEGGGEVDRGEGQVIGGGGGEGEVTEGKKECLKEEKRTEDKEE